MTYKSHGRKGARWRRLRAQVLEANNICWLCGKPGADSVDHVLPLSIYPELAHDMSNLRPAHIACNSSKGAGANAPRVGPMPRSRQW